MDWSNTEVNDKMHEYFEVRNEKILVSLPGLNRLLFDPRCPYSKQPNLVKYLLKVQKQLIQRNLNGTIRETT